MHVIWNTVHHGPLYLQFKNKDTIFRVERFSDLAYELYSCVEIAVNLIPTEYGHLVQWHWGFFKRFKLLCIIITQKNMGTWCSDTVIVYSGSIKWLGVFIAQKNLGSWFSDIVIVYSGSFKIPSIVRNQQNMVPWCSDTVIFFSGSFKILIIFINRNIWNQYVFCLWVGYKFVLDNVIKFIV